jgi:hypothetical protein
VEEYQRAKRAENYVWLAVAGCSATVVVFWLLLIA